MILSQKETMEKFNVEFYSKENEEQPAKDFILGLDSKLKAKILKILDLLENNGPLSGTKYSKHLKEGIFEIRVKQSTNIVRVLYFFAIEKRIILTNGFVKKTQKTPKWEIDLAKMYRDDFERRCQNEQL